MSENNLTGKFQVIGLNNNLYRESDSSYELDHPFKVSFVGEDGCSWMVDNHQLESIIVAKTYHGGHLDYGLRLTFILHGEVAQDLFTFSFEKNEFGDVRSVYFQEISSERKYLVLDFVKGYVNIEDNGFDSYQAVGIDVLWSAKL
jgi:hypothetical protein